MSSAPIERKIREICDAIDCKSYKQAVKISTNVLNKSPDEQAVRTLRAMANMKMGKEAKALEDCEEVVKACPTDEKVLSYLYLVARGLDSLELSTRAYETAHKALPAHFGLAESVFFSHVREQNFKGQQMAAMKLNKMKPCARHFFWVATSMYLQRTSTPMLLKLAANFVKTAFREGHVDSLEKLKFSLNVLQEAGEGEDALQLLEKDEYSSLFKLPSDRLEFTAGLLESLGHWAEAQQKFETILREDSCENWLHYMAVLRCIDSQAGEKGASETESARKGFLEFVKTLHEKRDTSSRPFRSPHLFPLHYHSAYAGSDEEALEALMNYFDRFGDRACWYSDVRPFLMHFNGIDLVAKLKDRATRFAIGEDAGVREKIRACYREISIERITCSEMLRSSDATVEELLTQAAHLLQRYSAHMSQIQMQVKGEDGNVICESPENVAGVLEKGERQHPDDMLLLAVHMMLEAFFRDGTRYTLQHVALAALRQGILCSPHNFHFILLSVRLYCMLGAVPEAMVLFKRLDVKQIQFNTLTHLILDDAICHSALKTSSDLLQSVIKYNRTSLQEMSELLTNPYREESFTRVSEFVTLREKLRRSRWSCAIGVESKVAQALLGQASQPPSAVHNLTSAASAAKSLVDADDGLVETCDNAGLDGIHSLCELSTEALLSTSPNLFPFARRVAVLKARVQWCDTLAKAFNNDKSLTADQLMASAAQLRERLAACEQEHEIVPQDGRSPLDATCDEDRWGKGASSVRKLLHYWSFAAVLADTRAAFITASASLTSKAPQVPGELFKPVMDTLSACCDFDACDSNLAMSALRCSTAETLHVIAPAVLFMKVVNGVPKLKKSATPAARDAAKDLREVLKVAKAAVMSRLQRECAALEGVLSQMWEGYTAGEGEMHAEGLGLEEHLSHVCTIARKNVEEEISGHLHLLRLYAQL